MPVVPGTDKNYHFIEVADRKGVVFEQSEVATP
jgi:hypothetical protein